MVISIWKGWMYDNDVVGKEICDAPSQYSQLSLCMYAQKIDAAMKKCNCHCWAK